MKYCSIYRVLNYDTKSNNSMPLGRGRGRRHEVMTNLLLTQTKPNCQWLLSALILQLLKN